MDVVREDVISMIACVRVLILYLLTVIKSYLSLGISAFGEHGEASMSAHGYCFINGNLRARPHEDSYFRFLSHMTQN